MLAQISRSTTMWPIRRFELYILKLKQGPYTAHVVIKKTPRKAQNQPKLNICKCKETHTFNTHSEEEQLIHADIILTWVSAVTTSLATFWPVSQWHCQQMSSVRTWINIKVYKRLLFQSQNWKLISGYTRIQLTLAPNGSDTGPTFCTLGIHQTAGACCRSFWKI